MSKSITTTRQQIRAAAVQAAAMFVSQTGGTVDDVMATADIFAGYIARGSSLVPGDNDQPSRTEGLTG